MTYRAVTAFVALMLMMATPGPAVGQTTTSGGQSWTPPLTAWGAPNLQGQWNSQTSTPLQRPLEGPLARREPLTSEDAAALEAANRESFDLPPREGSVGNYNAFWLMLMMATPGPAVGQTTTSGGQSWTPPLTAWGAPNLQGQWNSQTSTPLQRPLEGPLARREPLTSEDAAALEAANRESFDLPPREGSVGNYNAFWRDIGTPLTRTSLIVDPPDGRIPPLSSRAKRESTRREPSEAHGVLQALRTPTQTSAPGHAASRAGGTASGAGIAATIRFFRVPATSWFFRSSSTKRELFRWTDTHIFRGPSASGWVILVATGKGTRWSWRPRTSTPRRTTKGRVTPCT